MEIPGDVNVRGKLKLGGTDVLLLVQGMEKRIVDLNKKVEDLSKELVAVKKSDPERILPMKKVALAAVATATTPKIDAPAAPVAPVDAVPVAAVAPVDAVPVAAVPVAAVPVVAPVKPSEGTPIVVKKRDRLARLKSPAVKRDNVAVMKSPPPPKPAPQAAAPPIVAPPVNKDAIEKPVAPPTPSKRIFDATPKKKLEPIPEPIPEPISEPTLESTPEEKEPEVPAKPLPPLMIRVTVDSNGKLLNGPQGVSSYKIGTGSYSIYYPDYPTPPIVQIQSGRRINELTKVSEKSAEVSIYGGAGNRKKKMDTKFNAVIRYVAAK